VVLRQVIESGLPMIYANQMGGQDELVFGSTARASPSTPTRALPSR